MHVPSGSNARSLGRGKGLHSPEGGSSGSGETSLPGEAWGPQPQVSDLSPGGGGLKTSPRTRQIPPYLFFLALHLLFLQPQPLPLPALALPCLPLAPPVLLPQASHLPAQLCPAGRGATHMLRGDCGSWALALDRASVPLRGSGLQGSLLGEQVGTGEPRAGVGDRHRHRDRGEWARGLGSK